MCARRFSLLSELENNDGHEETDIERQYNTNIEWNVLLDQSAAIVISALCYLTF